MSLLYVDENGATIGIEGNRAVVKYSGDMKKSVPIETLEGVTILGKPQITTQFYEECLLRGIQISFFSKGGSYFGRLMSTGHINAELQRKQDRLYDTPFALRLGQRVLTAKIRNQEVVLRRYARSRNYFPDEHISQMRNSEKKIMESNAIDRIIGYEGIAAREYFAGLAQCINHEFHFCGRNKRPPRDPFNSMLSLGYSILMNEVYSEIETHGLNPYFGFIHRDAEKHPTLASDLMEEWRAVIVDSTVMALVNGNEIDRAEFYINEYDGGCYLTKEALRIFLNKIEHKMNTAIKYLAYIEYPTSFRRAISLQVETLIGAIDSEDATFYNPVVIR